jgi:hypothetical protein
MYLKFIIMKRILISIGSILIMAFVVVLFVNARNSQNSQKDPKKAKTEVNKVEVAAPCSATCNHSTGDKAAACDPEKCKEMNSAHKEGKCDPATCTAHKTDAQKESPACAQATACTGKCQSKTAGVK